MSDSSPGATAPATQHTIWRTSDKPLRFTGVLLGHGEAFSVVKKPGYGPSFETVANTFARLYRTTGGSYIWWFGRFEGVNQFDSLDELTDFERAEAVVVSPENHSEAHRRLEEPMHKRVWNFRPDTNRAVQECVAIAWVAATGNDPDLAPAAVEEIK